MVIASLNSENISVFAFLCSREYFSAQSKGLFLRNKRKMPRKTAALATFLQRDTKVRGSDVFIFCLRDTAAFFCVLIS
jgi:hypothetical protein